MKIEISPAIFNLAENMRIKSPRSFFSYDFFYEIEHDLVIEWRYSDK